MKLQIKRKGVHSRTVESQSPKHDLGREMWKMSCVAL
jgi:hypothetical protein